MIAAWIQHFLSEDKLWYHLHPSFKRGPHVPWFTGEGMLTTVGTVLFSAALTITVLFTIVAVLVSLFVLFCVFRPFVIIIKIFFSYYKVSFCHCFEATGIFSVVCVIEFLIGTVPFMQELLPDLFCCGVSTQLTSSFYEG